MEPRALMEQTVSLDELVQAALAVFLTVIGEGAALEESQGLQRREAELETAAKRFFGAGVGGSPP